MCVRDGARECLQEIFCISPENATLLYSTVPSHHLTAELLRLPLSQCGVTATKDCRKSKAGYGD